MGRKTSIRARYRRLRYVIIAALLAVLVSLPNLLSPIDLLTWAFQARLGQQELSGDIVFVEVPDTIFDDDREATKLRQSLAKLNGMGAEALFLDLARPQTSTKSDARLPDFLTGLRNVFVVVRKVQDRNSESLLVLPEEITSTSRLVVADHRPDFLGFVWRVPTAITVDGNKYPSFGQSLSGLEPGPSAIEIDYRFDARDVPSKTLGDIASLPSNATEVEGKSFVFGYSAGANGAPIDLPGSRAAPVSYVAIFAAETQRRGGLTVVSPHPFMYAPLLGLCVALLMAAALASARYRRLLYSAAVLACLIAVFAPIFLPFRTGIATSLFFLAVYGIRSLIFHWRLKIKLSSAETGLPSLQKLEQDLSDLPASARTVIVAAKIHNFSEVMATLSADARIDYFEGLVKRLRVGDTSLTVYSNSSDKLFWFQEFETQETLRSHLSALRAIFKNPLRINERPLDISVTFGVDLNFTGEPHRRIGQAEALTGRTSLSSQPILFGDEPDERDGEWRISLQSKIDAALESGQIFPVFQPQVDICSMETVGFEGLVRWKDSERGYIEPAYFIEQCEQAGRMERLQHFMLNDCIGKFARAPVMQSDSWLAINVSATLLCDSWLPELIDEVLADTQFPPHRLVLEITETARVPDHRTASAILESIAALGVHLSLDDFGTGSAGLENFLRLPFSEIKVDRLFTAAICDDPKARSIMANTLRLGDDLGVRIIVEGVENNETLTLLRDLGCRYAQGYLFGRPFFDLNALDDKDFQATQIR